jgi:hypothetical protein
LRREFTGRSTEEQSRNRALDGNEKSKQEMECSTGGKDESKRNSTLHRRLKNSSSTSSTGEKKSCRVNRTPPGGALTEVIETTNPITAEEEHKNTLGGCAEP